MARTMLEEDAKLPPRKSQFDMISDVTGVVYVSASDTTGSAVVSFFLAMLVYPEVQAKAQAEIDRVIGKDRLPEHEDRKDLPYVDAVVNECLRWLPVVPMGRWCFFLCACGVLTTSTQLSLTVPSKTTTTRATSSQRDPSSSALYGGSPFRISAVFIVTEPKSRSILHNATDYPDPERFHPDRYLTPDGQLDPTVRDPRTACFGFGRRVCPGRFFADASLFITVSTLLATVNVVRAKDAQGHEIVPDVAVTSGVLSYPKPFPWAVQSRGPHADDLLGNVRA
jgi:cytochrome P450